MNASRLSRAITLTLAVFASAPVHAELFDFLNPSNSGSQPEEKPAQKPPQKVIKAQAQPQAQQKPAIENRINPKKREGAQGSQEAKLDAREARELYMRRKRRLDQIRAQQTELTRDQQMLATNRARMQSRLVETARSLRLSERRLVEIEERLSTTRKAAQAQRAKLEDKTTQMSALFSVMQGMSRQPPPAIVTHSRDALNMIRGGMVMATFYSDVEKLASEISNELKKLESVQRDAEIQEQRRKAEQTQSARLKEQIDLMLIENREQLEATQSNLERLKNVAKIHAASMKTLEELVPKMDEEVAKVSLLGSYTQDLKQGGTDVTPDAAKVALSQPGRMKPSIPFSRAQGLLPMPAQGKVVWKFGQERDGVASPGMYLETRGGAQVVAPCDGWITYAGQFRSGGQLLIINTGDGYHIYMAGMDRTHVTLGQFVLAGEPVAAMGPVETRPDKTTIHPTLFIEFKKDKQSIDPSPWWSVGVVKG